MFKLYCVIIFKKKIISLKVTNLQLYGFKTLAQNNFSDCGFFFHQQELLRLNPKPLASCQWTTSVNGSTVTGEKGAGLIVAAGSGLARARATVKPSVATVQDRHHYKRNSSYAEVCSLYPAFIIFAVHIILSPIIPLLVIS